MNEMNITSAQYVRDYDDTKNIGIDVVVDGQQMCVPLDSGNRHYDEIMRQQSEGLLTIADAE